MFVPLYDGMPLRFTRSAFVTYGLIGACVLIQLLIWRWPGQQGDIAVMAGFGLIPSVLFGAAQLPEGLMHAPAWLTPFSNILIHASFAHLAGNMLFLWVFGDNVEDAMGHAASSPSSFCAGSAARWRMRPCIRSLTSHSSARRVRSRASSPPI